MLRAKSRLGFAALITVVCSALMMPTAATAAEVKTGLAPEVVASLQATWAENGVGTETPKALISKLDSGQHLGCDDGRNPRQNGH